MEKLPMQMSVELYSKNEVKRQFGRWAGETFSRKYVMAQEIGTLSQSHSYEPSRTKNCGTQAKFTYT